MHYYKKNIGDYAKKTGRLTMLQHGSYTLLLDACYDRERFPTMDEAIEWTWASTTQEIEAVQFVLRKFFVLEGDVYVQPRVREEIEGFHAKATKNKEIATEREAKRKQSSTNRERFVHESSPDVHEAPPNQEPLTINQEPVKSRERASRLPDDWTPTDDQLAFCKAERPDLKPQEVAARFRDYWIAKAGKDGRKADWEATWRNWVRNERRQTPPQPYQTAADKAKTFADALTGRNREQPIDIIDLI